MDAFSEFLLEEDILTDYENEDEEADDDREKVKIYDDEDAETEGKYESTFSLHIPNAAYVDEDGISCYKVLYEELEPIDEKEPHDMKMIDETAQDIAAPGEDAVLTDYRNSMITMDDIGYPVEIINDVMNISYDMPELINGQETYQRIVFEADIEGESIYNLTKRKLAEAGMEHSDAYDAEFSSMIFTSINQKVEGNEGNFNEFYLNGEIGSDAVDRQHVKKGDIVEWRYAEETDGSCGGVPDFNKIKSLYQYSMNTNNGMLSMQQIYGLLS